MIPGLFNNFAQSVSILSLLFYEIWLWHTCILRECVGSLSWFYTFFICILVIILAIWEKVLLILGVICKLVHYSIQYLRVLKLFWKYARMWSFWRLSNTETASGWWTSHQLLLSLTWNIREKEKKDSDMPGFYSCEPGYMPDICNIQVSLL